MKGYRINHQIRSPNLRVIDSAGNNLGVLTLSEALNRAQSEGVDLIELSTTIDPPIAKLMDYGKFLYLQNKKTRQSKAKIVQTETKSIQVTIGTGDHDLEIKARKASEFLAQGHRVKIDLFLRGRAKYFDQNFLAERLERLMKFITTAYRIADAAKRSPKGLTIVLERAK